MALNAQLLNETQWFFGSSTANLQFDKNGLQVYQEDRMNADFGLGGPAVINHSLTGNLLLYTDGVRVYDGSGEIMSGAIDLNGDAAVNQTALACPSPDDADRYIVFTNASELSAEDELQYSIVDLSAQGNGSLDAPLGEVVSNNNSVGLFSPAEGMTVVQSATNSSLSWLIAQNRGTHAFYVYKITNDGVDPEPVSILDPFTTDIREFEAAHMSMNPVYSILAVAPKTALRNVMLMNFNDTSGVLSFNSQILNTGFPDDAKQNIYDAEWSNDGSKLYLSRYGAFNELSGDLYLFDLTDSLNLIQSILPDPVYRSYGLKRAIDGKLYHLVQEEEAGPYLVKQIKNIDGNYDFIEYDNDFSTTDFQSTQFPSFAPGTFEEFTSLDFTYLDSCQDLSTKFFPLVDPPANKYLWDFGDGNGINSIAPIHAYESASSYNVTLYVELNGKIQSITKSINIIAEEMEVNLISDTTICDNEILTLDPQAEDGISYQWNTGETTSTIDIDTAGIYWVEITGASGCTKYAESSVTEYGAQRQIQNKWYFGETAGIEFTDGPLPIDDGNQMNSLEGCATIDDVDGNLVFYTNGKTIWNRAHQVMPFLTDSIQSLSGDSTSSQGTLIIPFMDDITMFYVFTAGEVDVGETHFPMTYAIVDMKKDSARGAVVLSNLSLFDQSIEKITSSGFSLNAWLITHEFGNNSFRTNLIDDEGIGETVYTPIGSVLEAQTPEHASGYMTFGSGTRLFANTIPGPNTLEIFDFDNQTGNFENVRQIETAATDDLYGLAFSSDGSKIYTSSASELIQFNLDSLHTEDEITYISSSKYDDYSSGGVYGALQRGPNGIIYLAIDQGVAVGTISNPALEGSAANFNATGFDLLGHTSRKGLPSFVQNSGSSLQNPTASYVNACFGLSTQFYASGSSTLDEYFWVFYDSLSQTDTLYATNEQTTEYEYGAAGFQYFTLNITNRCGYDSLITDTLEVYSLPVNPDITESASICDEFLELAAWNENRSDYNYYWSSGDTARTIEIFDPTTLYLAIINDDGCSSDTLEIFVGDGRPDLDLGIDQQYCQFDTAPDLNSYISDLNTQQWTIDGIAMDTTSTQSISTGLSGIFEYTIYAKEDEAFGGCSNADTILISVKAAPELNPTYTPPSNCGAADALLSLFILSEGNYRYDFSGIDISTFGSIDGPDTLFVSAGLSAGVYNYKITDLVSSCIIENPIIIEDDAPFSLSANNLPDCDIDANLSLTVSGVVLPSAVNIYISDVNYDTVYTENNLYVPLSLTPELDSGFYYVTVEEIGDSGPCVQSDTVLITPLIAGINDCQPEIFAPNAFSPNGNSQNENFFVYPNLFVDQFEIFIYTRWGEQIYYSNDKNFSWDGTYNDQIMGPATYAYVIKYTHVEKPTLGIQTQYGSISLIK
jgi:gliding motility-associated-like protein